jgi:hypothetical protein
MLGLSVLVWGLLEEEDGPSVNLMYFAVVEVDVVDETRAVALEEATGRRARAIISRTTIDFMEGWD